MKDGPTNADLAQQIETLAQAVAKGFEDVEKLRTEMIERFDRIENNHVRRIENLELASVDFRRDITKLQTRTSIE
jgi:hypothetical protein